MPQGYPWIGLTDPYIGLAHKPIEVSIHNCGSKHNPLIQVRVAAWLQPPKGANQRAPAQGETVVEHGTISRQLQLLPLFTFTSGPTKQGTLQQGPQPTHTRVCRMYSAQVSGISRTGHQSWLATHWLQRLTAWKPLSKPLKHTTLPRCNTPADNPHHSQHSAMTAMPALLAADLQQLLPIWLGRA
jgi:hypothetical protein